MDKDVKNFCLKEETKSTIKDFCELVYTYSKDGISLVNEFEFEKELIFPYTFFVFYAKTKEDFVSNYLYIYQNANTTMLEIVNNNFDEDKFDSFEEMVEYYIENPDEFLEMRWCGDTHFKFEGENLYTMWDYGWCGTHTLKSVIKRIKDRYKDFTPKKVSKESVNKLYDYVINNIEY